MAYVYRHIRLDKNQPFYIGIGSDSEYKRANEKARRNNIWKKIVSKSYYEIEILFDNITYDEAKVKEVEFISLYGRIDLNTGTLSNMTAGGDGTLNMVYTAEYRKKLSDKAKAKVLTEEQKEKLRKFRLGVPSTAEVRAKISKALSGRKLSEKHIKHLKNRIGERNPMFGKTGMKSANYKCHILAYRENELVGTFEGVNDCGRKLEIQPTKISAVLNGKRNHVGGYTFKRLL